MGKAEVAAYFHAIGRDDLQILEFDVSCATVELAAAAIGVAPGQIAKTLSFQLKERMILIVMSGSARLSNRKFKAAFGEKARLAPHEAALALTGHAVGGVCPFGLKTPLDVYLDQSLRKFSHVYPAAGAGNNMVRVAVAELPGLVDTAGGAAWVDVAEDADSQ